MVSGDAPQLDSTSSPWMWTWEEVLVGLRAALSGAIWLNCTLDRQPVNPGVLYLYISWSIFPISTGKKKINQNKTRFWKARLICTLDSQSSVPKCLSQETENVSDRARFLHISLQIKAGNLQALVWLGFSAMLSLKRKAGVKESSENRRPGKKNFFSPRGCEREGRWMVIARVSPPSWSCERCPFLHSSPSPSCSSQWAGTAPVQSHPLDSDSLHRETGCPFTGRPSVPSPGDHTSLHQETGCPFTRRPHVPSARGGQPPLPSLLPSCGSAERWREPTHPCRRLRRSVPAPPWQALRRLRAHRKLAILHLTAVGWWASRQLAAMGLHPWSPQQLSSNKVPQARVVFSLIKHQLNRSQNAGRNTLCVPWLPRSLQAAHGCFPSARTCCDSPSHSWNKTGTLCQLAVLAGVFTFQSPTAVSNRIFRWQRAAWLPLFYGSEAKDTRQHHVCAVPGSIAPEALRCFQSLPLGWQEQEWMPGPGSQWENIPLWAEQSKTASPRERTGSSPRQAFRLGTNIRAWKMAFLEKTMHINHKIVSQKKKEGFPEKCEEKEGKSFTVRFWGRAGNQSTSRFEFCYPKNQIRVTRKCITNLLDEVLTNLGLYAVWAADTSGPHHLKRTLRYVDASRGGPQSWGRVWQACPLRSGWGLWVGLVWRAGGCGATSLLSAASWGGDVEREVPSSAPRCPVQGCVGSWRGGWCHMPASVYEAFGQCPSCPALTFGQLWRGQAVALDRCRSLPTEIVCSILPWAICQR